MGAGNSRTDSKSTSIIPESGRMSKSVWCCVNSCLSRCSIKRDSIRKRWDFFLKRFCLELKILWLNLKWILFCGIFQWVHKISTNIVYYVHEPRETLYDFGFAFFPALTPRTQIVSEYVFFIFLGVCVSFIVSPLFVKYNPPKYPIVMLVRFLQVLTLSQTLRVLTFLSTILPGPNYHCRPNSATYNPPTDVAEMLGRGDPFTGCGDLVFSSHTIFMVLFCLTYHKYGDSNYLKATLWMVVISFGCLIIAARKHYSIDVVVALYTVPLVWLVFDHYHPDYLPRKYVREAMLLCSDGATTRPQSPTSPNSKPKRKTKPKSLPEISVVSIENSPSVGSLTSLNSPRRNWSENGSNSSQDLKRDEETFSPGFKKL